jgi:IS30 family transposase
MPHEIDRKKVEKLLAEKMSQREIASRLNIPRSSLQRIITDLCIKN